MENIPELTSLIGKELQAKDGLIDSQKALKTKVLGLYFSAHWCTPCQQFTPLLADFYIKLKNMSADFEVIFISSDQDENSFNKYFHEMPWLAIPLADHRIAILKTKFRVLGIPCLIFIDPNTGNILSNEGRDLVGEEDFNKLLDWCGFDNN